MNISTDNFDPPAGDVERIKNEFNAGLDKLTFNCRNTIHGLTKYAESRIAYAATIADELEKRIRKSNASSKLPYLYLLDSMAKNVGNAYIPLFSKNLKQLFLENFMLLQDDATKRSFLKVLQTWRFVFDRSLVHSIEGEIFGSEVPENYSAIPAESLVLMKRMIGAPVPQEPPTTKPTAVPAFAPEALEQSAALLASLQALKIPIINPLLSQPSISTRQSATGINASVPAMSKPAATLPGTKRKVPSASSHVPRPTERQRERQPVKAQPPSRAPVRTRPSGGVSRVPTKIDVSTEFINKKYPEAHLALYGALKLACKNCGLRFHDSPSSRQSLAIHLDWHFRRNRRIKERLKKPISRDWFPTEKEWLTGSVSFEDSLTLEERQATFSFPGAATDTGAELVGAGEGSSSAAQNRLLEAKIHTVPTRLAYDMKECNSCGEKFALSWNEEADEWVYENAVLDEENESIFHFTCSSNDSHVPSEKRKRNQ